MLVKACLSTVKVSKHRFTHRRSLVKLVQAGLSTVKVCERIFTIVKVSEARVGQLKCGERFKTWFLTPWTSSSARESLLKFLECL